MKFKRSCCALGAVLLMSALPLGARAAQVECDAVYCFATTDFSAEENLTGICITGALEQYTKDFLAK